MSINFSGTSQRLTFSDSNIDVSRQMSFSIWVRRDANATFRRIFMMNNNAAGADSGWQIAQDFDGAQSFNMCASNGASTWGAQTSGKARTTSINNNQWYHICGTVSADTVADNGIKTLDAAFLDGVAMTIDAGDDFSKGNPLELVYVGARSDNAQHFDGDLAEATIWNDHLFTAEEALALAAGAPTTSIDPENIKFYAPMQELDGVDLITGTTSTKTGSPVTAEHSPTTMVPWNAVVPTVASGAQNLSPTGIASTEAFGTAVITTGAVNLSPTGIASEEAFGSHTVTLTQDVSPSGIASEEAFGTAVLTTGAVNLSPTGIASEEAFGTADVSQATFLTPTGIPSTEAFGTAVITTGAVTLSPTGIASAEAFGSHTVTLDGDKDIKIDFANEKVLNTNLQSTTLYFNGEDYFTID